jgi:hypothetical protein
MKSSGQGTKQQRARAAIAKRGALWFGLLGGGLAWLAHLLLAYFIAEFGCLAGWGEIFMFDVTAVAWAVIASSALTLVVAIAASLVAFRARKRLAGEQCDAEPGTELELARAGFITSSLFTFVILVQSVPVFFYLRHC